MTEYTITIRVTTMDDFQIPNEWLRHILAYVQLVGLMPSYDLNDIVLLVQAAGKDYLWLSYYAFMIQDLELSDTLLQELRRLHVDKLMQLRWILKV